MMNQAMLDSFERFIVRRASKYAYTDLGSRGQDIRQGLSSKTGEGVWNFVDVAETNAIMFLYKFLDENQTEEPRIKYKFKSNGGL